MSMGRRRREQQSSLYIAAGDIDGAPGHAFYDRLSSVLTEADFDTFVETRCAEFYADNVGRRSIPPGVYFRMLMVGYFEGIDSERGIAWRCADSLSLREFLGLELTERTPEHSSLSRIRQKIDIEAHSEVFTWVLGVLAEKKLVRGQRVGIDATTLEANAAMRSIVRRDTEQPYSDYLDDLARASGIETPKREDRQRVDRKRKGKASNDDWKHPGDPDARVTKMKDGRTHLAHKAEHAVDLDTTVIVGVTIQPADRGDTTSVFETLEEASEQVKRAADSTITDVIADRGYHSNDVIATLTELDIRTSIAEPKRPRRRWRGNTATRNAVYGNRRRLKRDKGVALQRKRGEVVERSFAHCLESGAMRRVHLRGRENITKRYLVHVAAFNLGVLMRSMLGVGTPRGLARVARAADCVAQGITDAIAALNTTLVAYFQRPQRTFRAETHGAPRLRAA